MNISSAYKFLSPIVYPGAFITPVQGVPSKIALTDSPSLVVVYHSTLGNIQVFNGTCQLQHSFGYADPSVTLEEMNAHPNRFNVINNVIVFNNRIHVITGNNSLIKIFNLATGAFIESIADYLPDDLRYITDMDTDFLYGIKDDVITVYSKSFKFIKSIKLTNSAWTVTGKVVQVANGYAYVTNDGSQVHKISMTNPLNKSTEPGTSITSTSPILYRRGNSIVLIVNGKSKIYNLLDFTNSPETESNVSSTISGISSTTSGNAAVLLIDGTLSIYDNEPSLDVTIYGVADSTISGEGIMFDPKNVDLTTTVVRSTGKYVIALCSDEGNFRRLDILKDESTGAVAKLTPVKQIYLEDIVGLPENFNPTSISVGKNEVGDNITMYMVEGNIIYILNIATETLIDTITLTGYTNVKSLLVETNEDPLVITDLKLWTIADNKLISIVIDTSVITERLDSISLIGTNVSIQEALHIGDPTITHKIFVGLLDETANPGANTLRVFNIKTSAFESIPNSDISTISNKPIVIKGKYIYVTTQYEVSYYTFAGIFVGKFGTQFING